MEHNKLNMNTQIQIMQNSNVDIVTQQSETSTYDEFIFNKLNINLIPVIKFSKIKTPFEIAIETKEVKLYLKKLFQFKLNDCSIKQNNEELIITYNDNDIAEINEYVSKQFNNPTQAYFYILGQILNKDIITTDNNIGIVNKGKLFQIHTWEQNESQIYGIRAILPYDKLREINIKNAKEEKIQVFDSLILLFKQ